MDVAGGRGESKRQETMNRICNLSCVVALAAGLVALSPGVGEAVPITTDSDPITWGFDSETLSNDYEFGFYTFRIAFTEVFTSFELTVDDLVQSTLPAGYELDATTLSGYQCVEMGLLESDPTCAFFEVSPGGESESLPTSDGGDFAGPVLIGLGYSVFGFPECDPEVETCIIDPVDIGEILDFSFFSVFYNLELDRYTMGHGPHNESEFVDIGIGHCDGTSDIDVCLAQLPEPGSILLLSVGITGIVIRQVRRRRG